MTVVSQFAKRTRSAGKLTDRSESVGRSRGGKEAEKGAGELHFAENGF